MLAFALSTEEKQGEREARRKYLVRDRKAIGSG
jgi:hypothetical protein